MITAITWTTSPSIFMHLGDVNFQYKSA